MWNGELKTSPWLITICLHRSKNNSNPDWNPCVPEILFQSSGTRILIFVHPEREQSTSFLHWFPGFSYILTFYRRYESTLIRLTWTDEQLTRVCIVDPDISPPHGSLDYEGDIETYSKPSMGTVHSCLRYHRGRTSWRYEHTVALGPPLPKATLPMVTWLLGRYGQLTKCAKEQHLSNILSHALSMIISLVH